MRIHIVSIFLILGSVLLFSCSRTATPSVTKENQSGGQVAVPSPPCIVYKTRSDYSQQVPVILSADRKTVVSYPDIKDVYVQGKLAYPTQLEGGYLLDNRGIGPQVAFLTYTYEEYSKLDHTPTADILFGKILDKKPLREMYDCGPRSKFTDPVNELNEIIRSGRLKSEMKRLK